MSEKRMTVEEAIAFLAQHLERGRLTKVQEILFRGTWEGKTYQDIARESGYDAGHIKDTGADLWRSLSQALGEKVTKHNLSGVLQRAAKRGREGPTVSIMPVDPTVQLTGQPATSRLDWGEAIDVSRFYGRTLELDTLNQWILRDRCRLVALLGMGGIGKTALSVKMAEQLQGEFEFVIWRSLRHAPALKDILTHYIKLLSHQQVSTLPGSAHEQITCLIEYLRKFRCLIVLDNFDTLLQQGNRAGHYREGYEAYGELLWRLGETQHQSCVVITSREKPVEIVAIAGDALPIRALALSGLSLAAGQTILSLKGLTATQPEVYQLVEHYRGNPLALKIAATSIQDLYDGNIAQFFAEGTSVFNGIVNLLEQHWQCLSVAEKQVMYWLAVNREAVSIAELQADLLPLLSKATLMKVLNSLYERNLVERSSGQFTQQPVVMEYVTEHFVEQVCQEIITEAPQFLLTHALMKAQAKDYIRDSQICLIIRPLLDQLRSHLGSDRQIQHQLNRLVNQLQDEHDLAEKRDFAAPQATPDLRLGGRADVSGYGGGNLLNLLAQLDVDLSGYNFSKLKIRQADLRSLNLHRVNFTQATFRECAFASTFGGITCVSFNPSGEYLATSDTNGEIYLWNREGQQRVACKGHNNWVWSLAFSPRQAILASCGQDQTIKLWNTTTGACFNTLQGHVGIVTSIAFSPDGQFLASTGYDRSIKLWHVATGTCLQTLEGCDACIWSVAFHPSGQLLATAGEDQKIRLWNLETRSVVKLLEGHQHWVKAVAFNPDGTKLVSGGFDQTVKLWDVSTGLCLMSLLGHMGVVTAVAFHPMGDRFASSSYDQTIKLWSTTTGACLDTLKKHTNRVWSIAFHPQRPLLASGGDDHAARVWELHTGQCIQTLQGHSNAIYAIAHNAHSHLLASGHEDQTVKLWDIHLNAPHSLTASLQPFRILSGHGDRILSTAFSPNGQWLASASADRSIKLWNPHTGQCVYTLHGHGSWVWCVAFSPDSQYLASGSYDHTIKLWSVQSGECLQTWQGHPSSVLAIAFSADGTFLVSGGYDQMIKIWDCETGQCLSTWQAHGNRVWAVDVSSDNQTLATGGDDHTIKLWHLPTQTCLHTLSGHSSQLLCLQFTAAGERLISGSADGTIKIWEAHSGKCLTTLQGHQSWVWSLNLSLDNQTLLSSSQDETLKCWDITTGRCWQTLRVIRPYEGMIIHQAMGLTEAETTTLKALGAYEI